MSVSICVQMSDICDIRICLTSASANEILNRNR